MPGPDMPAGYCTAVRRRRNGSDTWMSYAENTHPCDWEVAVPVIVITRLRLRDPEFFDEFFSSAMAVIEQAQTADGNLAADALADANNTYWTRTAWQDRDRMNAFVGGEPHLRTMSRIDDWCDEATFVDWEQPTPDVPSWREGHERLIGEGQAASLTCASPAHHTRSFPVPIEAA
jgi:hypothetical protein